MNRFFRWMITLLVGLTLAGCGDTKTTAKTTHKKKSAKKKVKAEKKPVTGKTKIGGVWGGMFLDEYRKHLKSDDADERVRGCQGLAGLGERALDALADLKQVAASDTSQRVRAEAKKAIREIER